MGIEERIKAANELIEYIAGNGRGFFGHTGKISRFEKALNSNRLYFIDKYTGERLPLSHPSSERWRRKFSQGGTMQSLVFKLANFIRTGKKVPGIPFGPWPEWICGGDLWGYGEEAMSLIRDKAVELGVWDWPKSKFGQGVCPRCGRPPWDDPDRYQKACECEKEAP